MQLKWKKAIGVAATAVAIAGGGAGLASADDISNNVGTLAGSTPGHLNLTAGGSNATVTFALAVTNDDGNTGCNISGRASETVFDVASDNTAAATLNASTITFASCGALPTVTVHPVAVGTANVTVTFKSTTSSAGGTYNVSQAGFQVNVSAAAPANTAPSVNVPADITTEATGSSGAVVTYSVTASDAEDGALTPVCAPPSGSTFPIGTTTVHGSVTDGGGLSDNDSFDVTVEDTTAPTLNLPSDITAEATGPSGAAVTFTATGDDLVDGSVPADCDATSGDTFPLGTTTVTCTASDSTGNTSDPGTFDVTVQDTTAPTLNLPDDITTAATSNSGAVVTYSATGTDLVDGTVAADCLPLSGSTFLVGTTIVTCTATDAAGNTSDPGSFNVTVNYNGSGFFQPVDHNVLNLAKAGSGIPVKFSLGGNQGLNVFATGYPRVATMTCDAGAPTDAIETTVTAGGSSLTYDATSGQYVYVWKTDKAWAGSCKQLQVKLADGSVKTASFKFTK